jgi:predicted nucleotide-binding protein (sugar kinase/HSP70/actin superfamily)
MKMAVRDRSARLWGGNLLQDIVQRRIARQIGRPFHDLLGDIEEPRTARLLQRTAFCVNPELEGGEAVLCAAKTLEWHEHGVDGVIAVMPFGCMPTTIFAGLTKSLAEETGNMPLLTIAYDGQQDATLQTRLEAFAHQARMYRQAMRRESRLGRSRRRRVRRTDPELPVPCHRA